MRKRPLSTNIGLKNQQARKAQNSTVANQNPFKRRNLSFDTKSHTKGTANEIFPNHNLRRSVDEGFQSGLQRKTLSSIFTKKNTESTPKTETDNFERLSFN